MAKLSSCDARKKIKAIKELKESVKLLREELEKSVKSVDRFKCQYCKCYKKR